MTGPREVILIARAQASSRGLRSVVMSSDTPATISGITITCGSYVGAHAITFESEEDSAVGPAEIVGLFAGVMLQVLEAALDDDLLALAASLSQTVGTSTSDLTIAQGLMSSCNPVFYEIGKKHAFERTSNGVSFTGLAAASALSASMPTELPNRSVLAKVPSASGLP